MFVLHFQKMDQFLPIIRLDERHHSFWKLRVFKEFFVYFVFRIYQRVPDAVDVIFPHGYSNISIAHIIR